MNRRTRGLASMAAGLLLLAVGGLGPAGGVITSKAAGTSAGATSTQTLRALACPSVTVCYAVGDRGTILATHDEGATWQRQTSGTQDAVSRIACPAASVCFALSYPPGCGGPTQVSLLRTTDGGSTWQRRILPQNCPGPGPSCPSVTTCYTFASCAPPLACPPGSFEPGNPELYRTTNGGAGWQDEGRIPDNTTTGNNTAGIGVQSLACPTPTVCYAGGLDQLARSADGGKHWTRRFIYVAPCPTAEIYCHQLNLMACPGQRICYAGGTSVWGSVNPYAKQNVTAVVVATPNGFRTWRRSVMEQFHGLVALSCPTPTHCFALGGGSGPFSDSTGTINETGRFAATTDGGTTWRVRRIARYPFTALACPSVGICYAAGYLGRLTGSTDGGTTWHDLLPAVFTAGRAQSRYMSSPWFAASHPWHLTLGLFSGRTSPGHYGFCLPDVSVRDARSHVVAGPLQFPDAEQMSDFERHETTVSVKGKLRLDLTAGCSAFVLRIDGVK